MTEPAAAPRRRPVPVGRLLLVAALLAALVGVGVWLTGGDSTPAGDKPDEAGPVTVTLTTAPDELPDGIVPPGATEVEGTVARDGETLTAAVSFVLAADRDEVRAHVDGVLAGTDWLMRQRVYDEESMLIIYDRPDEAVLTVTYETLDSGTGTAIVIQAG